MLRKYGIGLSIGIGYIGFAVISQTTKEDARIEDVGVRLFASGETNDHKAKKGYERRLYRNARRLVRRRVHRKERAKNFLQKLGLITCDDFKEWQEKNGKQNVFAIRLKGLDERLQPTELADCVIHFCNHRGYYEYYEGFNDKDAGVVRQGLENFMQCYETGNYRSVADMILHDEAFKTATDFPDYHNHFNSERFILIKRSYLRKELLDILYAQKQYYPQLTEANIQFLCDRIVFAQRDFETGPGNEDDRTRKFMGFLDSVGKCRFYQEERCGFRSSVIADVYTLVNCLSQYAYINEETEIINLPREVAKAIINDALVKASVSEKDVKAILKGFGIKMIRSGKIEVKLADTTPTLRILKESLAASGYNDLISEEQFDLEYPSRLQQLCLLLSQNITPKRRAKVLKANGWNDSLCQKLSYKKFSGTINVCERYMVEAIKAFLNGEAYGNFQERFIREKEVNVGERKKNKFLPAITINTDEAIAKDIVVFKAINEARKIINALVGKYGSPSYINVEVADFLGRSFKEREKLIRLNKDKQKLQNSIENKLVALGLREPDMVKSSDVLRYQLWKMQGGIDLYTGEAIAERDVLSNAYEVNHIVPFSLVLDDSIHNKALVSKRIALKKGQDSLLAVLADVQAFKIRVRKLLEKRKISTKKYNYLTLDSLYTPQARATLEEWKLRNINDTRYVTRYIVNYFQDNLCFEGNRFRNVHAIRSGTTSKMRKLWLNRKSWGGDLTGCTSNLRYAVDAVVIANLTPAYIELVNDTLKLQSIFRRNNNQAGLEYDYYLQSAVSKMVKYYGFEEDFAKKLLGSKGRIPSLVRGLRTEVDKRLVDCNLEYFKDITAEKFMCGVKDYYRGEQAFAESLAMPLVSYKPNRKYQGQFTDDNPIPKEKRKNTSVVKLDTLGNENILRANKYYCIEIYEDGEKRTTFRGIRYVDLVKRHKKLFLNIPYPENYHKHIMYLFANDYIRVYDAKANVKFEGYYRSVKAVTRSLLTVRNNNANFDISIYVTQKDIFKKYHIDILGKVGGEIRNSIPFPMLVNDENKN